MAWLSTTPTHTHTDTHTQTNKKIEKNVTLRNEFDFFMLDSTSTIRTPYVAAF